MLNTRWWKCIIKLQFHYPNFKALKISFMDIIILIIITPLLSNILQARKTRKKFELCPEVNISANRPYFERISELLTLLPIRQVSNAWFSIESKSTFEFLIFLLFIKQPCIFEKWTKGGNFSKILMNTKAIMNFFV